MRSIFFEDLRALFRDFAQSYVRQLYQPKNWRWYHTHARRNEQKYTGVHPCTPVHTRIRRVLCGHSPLEAARHKRRAALQRMRMVPV